MTGVQKQPNLANKFGLFMSEINFGDTGIYICSKLTTVTIA